MLLKRYLKLFKNNFKQFKIHKNLMDREINETIKKLIKLCDELHEFLFKYYF